MSDKQAIHPAVIMAMMSITQMLSHALLDNKESTEIINIYNSLPPQAIREATHDLLAPTVADEGLDEAILHTVRVLGVTASVHDMFIEEAKHIHEKHGALLENFKRLLSEQVAQKTEPA
ncbi:MAG: hypothetical protein KAH38_04495, partial [Candidatus Hydrogenedentes bacterium]|nr:hypothetical protein [Candidatus Hydrogenedentota bacterium]